MCPVKGGLPFDRRQDMKKPIVTVYFILAQRTNGSSKNRFKSQAAIKSRTNVAGKLCVRP